MSLYADRKPIGDLPPMDLGETPKVWSSPARDFNDPRYDHIEFRFRQQVVVNHISFHVGHLPHQGEVQVWDKAHRHWRTHAVWTINASSPVAFNTQPNAENIHFQRVSLKFDPVVTSRVRLRFQRVVNPATPPRFVPRPLGHWTDVAYPMVVKGLDIGYRVASKDDLPPPDDPDPIDVSRDITNAQVVYQVYREPAFNLLAGEQWRSEPQPISYSIVNLYADLRDSQGDGQLVDRFFLDPLNDGPTCNLYWSNDQPTSDFEASTRPLAGIVDHGDVEAVHSQHIRLGGDEPSFLDVPAPQVQWDPSRGWWAGMVFRPTFPSVGADACVVDLGAGISLWVVDQTIQVRTAGSTASAPVDFTADALVSVTFGFTPGQGLMIRARAHGVQTEGVNTGVVVLSSERPTMIRFGGRLNSGSNTSPMRLVSFMLKQQSPENAPDEFTTSLVRRGRWTQEDPTRSALLRFVNTLLGGDNFGFIGGPGDHYAGMVWHPIARNYQVTTGFLRVPPTKARFWKFEFTNLVPEPYEVFVPINRDVKVFPVDVVAQTTVTDASVEPGDGVLEAEGIRQYTDALEFLRDPPPIDEGQIRPTEVPFALDPAVRETLREENWALGWMPWHIPHSTPVLIDVGEHRYETISIRHTGKVGFFIGLKALRAYRVDYTVNDNTTRYLERFSDESNIEYSTWEMEDGHLSVGATGTVVAVSKVFNSHHKIRAIQFAGVQSNPIQIMPDHDFAERVLLATYDWEDTGLWHRVGSAYLSYEWDSHSVRVARNPVEIARFNGVSSNLVESIVHPTFSFRETPEGGGNPPPDPGYGGIASPLISVSDIGRVWATARVTADHDLTAPLYIQILGEDGTLLVESPRMIREGEVAEWYIGYEIGSLQPLVIYEDPPYEGSEIVQELSHPVFADEQGAPTSPPGGPAPIDNRVRIRLVQKGVTEDEWVLDTFSLFDEGILWEFSNDAGTTWVPAHGVRNNPNGAVHFPTPDNRLMWRVRGYREGMKVSSLQIRPWYIGLPTGKPERPFQGPNLSIFDHDPSIYDDPEFKVWHEPVPMDWFIRYRRGRPLSLEFIRARSAQDIITPQDEATRNTVYTRTASDSATLTDRVFHDPQPSRSSIVATVVKRPTGGLLGGWMVPPPDLGGIWL